LKLPGRSRIFYERHEKINKIIEKSIPHNSVLNCTVNWALYYINLMMQSGRNLADELLKEYTAMDSIELPVPKDLGFISDHLRWWPRSLTIMVLMSTW
jgi:hypothetical protein